MTLHRIRQCQVPLQPPGVRLGPNGPAHLAALRVWRRQPQRQRTIVINLVCPVIAQRLDRCRRPYQYRNRPPHRGWRLKKEPRGRL